MTQYQYTIGATPQTVTGVLGWNANGTLGRLQITDQLNSANSQTCTYGYDDLVRIASVSCRNDPTNIWGQTFSYDAFGNLKKYLVSGFPGAEFQPTYNPATNRISSSPFTYDANGNTTHDNVRSYTWDAEGKAVTADTISLTYDALGRMVESGTTQIVYAPTGQKMALMTGQTLSKAFIPLPGGAVAVYGASGTIAYYRHPDWLGSSRLATTPSRTLYSSLAYAPFGETYAESGTPDRSFTGQNQDTIQGGTAGLYDFLYREYAQFGRWISPDPAGLSAASLRTPQSLNRYAYVMNSPMRLVDPLGLRPKCFEVFKLIPGDDRWELGPKVNEFCIEVEDEPPIEPPKDPEKSSGGEDNTANTQKKQMDDCVRQFYNLGLKGKSIQIASLLSWVPGWNPDASLKNTLEWLIPPILKLGVLGGLHKLAIASERGAAVEPFFQSSTLTGGVLKGVAKAGPYAIFAGTFTDAAIHQLCFAEVAPEAAESLGTAVTP